VTDDPFNLSRLPKPALIAAAEALRAAVKAGEAAEKRGVTPTFAVDLDEDGASVTLTVAASRVAP